MSFSEDERVFPAWLSAKGVLLEGEYGWPADVVRETIEFLRKSGIAVLGVEVWLDEDGHPKVLGGSEYEVSFNGDWKRFVDQNAAEALAEIDRRRIPEDAFFNLTWMTELQGKRLR